MTDRDPPRIGAPDSGDSARLAALLRDARADVGTEDDVNALRTALAAQLWPQAPPPDGAGPTGAGAVPGASSGTAGGTAAASGTAFGIKAGLSALLVVAAAGTWLATRPPADPAPATGAHTETPPAHINPIKNEMRAAPTAVFQPESPPSTNGSGIIAIAPAAPSSTPPPARPPHDAAPSEPALLGQAQAALSRNAALALSLSEQHRAWYPRGMLVQEREVIAIEALQRLGRKAEASARAARFLKAFPASAHRSKIESLVPPR